MTEALVDDRVGVDPVVRRAADRGRGDHGWLKTSHSFSFADWADPERVRFGPLRVLNEDFIAPSSGFGMHGHRDMEIVTIVLDGELTHRDSKSDAGRSGAVIRPGDVQRMSAGSGIRHSEANESPDRPVHLLQIWLLPNVLGIAPGYEEKRFADADQRGRLRLVASPDGREGSVTVRSDASLSIGRFDRDESARFAVEAGRQAYVHVARGSATVGGVALAAGDALEVTAPGTYDIASGRDAEVLVFDLGT